MHFDHERCQSHIIWLKNRCIVFNFRHLFALHHRYAAHSFSPLAFILSFFFHSSSSYLDRCDWEAKCKNKSMWIRVWYFCVEEKEWERERSWNIAKYIFHIYSRNRYNIGNKRTRELLFHFVSYQRIHSGHLLTDTAFHSFLQPSIRTR